jgi:hypothetical protein
MTSDTSQRTKTMSDQYDQLFHIIIRVNKEDSAYFYFQLEANDGICFYSTLDYPLHAQYRDIDLKGDLKLVPNLRNIIKACEKRFKIEILTDEIIQDKV